MVHSESSGDARHWLSRENSGRTLAESEGASGSVTAGQPADPDPIDGVSGSAQESQLIPRSIPRESHGLWHVLRVAGHQWASWSAMRDRNILNWRVISLAVASWVALAVVVLVVVEVVRP